MSDKTPSMDILEALEVAQVAIPMNPWGRALHSLRHHFRLLDVQFCEMRERWQRSRDHITKLEELLHLAKHGLGEISRGESARDSRTIATHILDRINAGGVRICKANRSADPPQDCDWPHCGCDPVATKVLEALQEEGWLPPTPLREYAKRLEAIAEALPESACAIDRLDAVYNFSQARGHLTDIAHLLRGGHLRVPDHPNVKYDDALSRTLWAGPSPQHKAECDCAEFSGGKCLWPACAAGKEFEGFRTGRLAGTPVYRWKPREGHGYCTGCERHVDILTPHASWCVARAKVGHGFVPVAGTNTCRDCGFTYEGNDAHHPDARSSR
jgi:hypothetical protein